MDVLENLRIVKHAYKNWVTASLLMILHRGKSRCIKIIPRKKELICLSRIISGYFDRFQFKELGNKKLGMDSYEAYILARIYYNDMIPVRDNKAEELGKDIISLNIDGHSIKVKFKENSTLNGDIDVFVKGIYEFLINGTKNKIVIDIGANIGDSAIYFITKGAYRVFAMEPYPYSYNLAASNIKLNGFEDKITLIKAGYGKDGVLTVDDRTVNGSTELKESKKGNKINIYSLHTMLKYYGIDRDDLLLKMDCEGCEYNLLQEDNETLRKFAKIELEYHYGYEKLVPKLRNAGFVVKYSKPSLAFESGKSNPNAAIGMIYAKRA